MMLEWSTCNVSMAHTCYRHFKEFLDGIIVFDSCCNSPGGVVTSEPIYTSDLCLRKLKLS